MIEIRKLKIRNGAVSAVIGVILMVAITVAIAATVYYYVTTLAVTESGSTPTISWNFNAASNNLTITKCDPGDVHYGTDTAVAAAANLIFKSGGTPYYILTNGPTGCAPLLRPTKWVRAIYVRLPIRMLQIGQKKRKIQKS